jgi:hypothetical protein
MGCKASAATNIGVGFCVSSVLWASSFLLVLSTIASAQGISLTPSRIDPILDARVNPLCDARQITISPSGSSVAVVGVEEVGPSKSALYSMPSYGIMAWPEEATIALQNTNFATICWLQHLLVQAILSKSVFPANGRLIALDRINRFKQENLFTGLQAYFYTHHLIESLVAVLQGLMVSITT